jgi:hypothetical protein
MGMDQRFSHRRNRRRGSEPRDLSEWVLSLPWVVERPDVFGVRTFAIDCEPLAIRRVWLAIFQPTGSGSPRVAVVVPVRLAQDLEDAGLGLPMAAFPAEHALVRAPDYAGRAEVETLILAAYGRNMS